MTSELDIIPIEINTLIKEAEVITNNSFLEIERENDRALAVEEILNYLPSKPVLSTKELHTLYNYLDDVNVILEFGTGGSSFLFSALNKLVYSFDTDSDYIQNLQNSDMIESRLNIKHFFFYCDVGKVGAWGTPLKPDEYNFSSSIGKYLSAIDLSKIDLFFIDGRYRVESALSVFVNSRDNSIFIIHDFVNRSYYHELLDYFDVIKTADTLVVLKKKEKNDFIKLQEVIIKYQQDYR